MWLTIETKPGLKATLCRFRANNSLLVQITSIFIFNAVLSENLLAFSLIDLFILKCSAVLTFHANVFNVNSSIGPQYRIRMMLIEHHTAMILTGTSEMKEKNVFVC